MPLARDGDGNLLLAFLPPGVPPADAPMPAALAAVRHGRHMLLVFNRHRAHWELPGGLIDPGETPYEAAVRELHEESGLHLPALTLAGYGRFHLVRPPRDEYAALYTASTTSRHTAFTPNEEISAIRWWDTATPHPPDAQILDTTLARAAL
ncbi:NUDIX domain-containing protein [Actinomadura madurae]|uniref:NUDIX hydrolase n=1 Tax=Actinomadura madurae TaxID=1993 RepID=UPI00202711AF|nr:NUDIX domain-containing protein [Actinomadura madurae]URN02090.1 NUDIX domain-containing protein [Actinomadura madurae]